MMKQYVYTGSQQGDLNDQQNWEEHLEIPVLRLVMKHLHTQHAAQSPEARRHPKQRLFWYAPLPLTGHFLVMPHQCKGGDVRYRNDG